MLSLQLPNESVTHNIMRWNFDSDFIRLKLVFNEKDKVVFVLFIYHPSSPILHNSSSVNAVFLSESILFCSCFTELVPTMTDVI